MKKIIVPVVILLAFSACKKNNQTIEMNPILHGDSVYFSSYTLSGNYSPVYGDTWMATYFKNSHRQIIGMDSTLENKTTGIYVSGSDVYVCGSEGFQLNSVAKYWKNGQAVLLGAPGNVSGASAITGSGKDIYIAGMETVNGIAVAKYWKNGNSVALSDGTNNANATAIAISGTDIYVAGTQSPDVNTINPVYWKNGMLVSLPATGRAITTGIAISGTDVYVSGYIYDGANMGAVYWKNGSLVPLLDGSLTASPLVLQ